MAINTLTNADCLTAVGDKRQKLYDGCGLYLEIHPNGSRYWRMKYRFGGKEKTLALGLYPRMTLAQARAKRNSVQASLDQGNDPAASSRHQTHSQTSKTFAEVAHDWLERKLIAENKSQPRSSVRAHYCSTSGTLTMRRGTSPALAISASCRLLR